MRTRTIILGALVLVGSFGGALFMMNLLWPTSPQQGRPVLVAVPPLQPLSGTSTILVPAAIAMATIRDGLAAQAPKTFAGKRQNPISKVLSKADITWTVSRGPLNVSGSPDALAVTAPLSGIFQASGQIDSQIAVGASAIGNIIGGSIGQQMQRLAGKSFDQRVDIRGTVTASAHPAIAPNWRLAPNLTAQIDIADVAVPIAGIAKLSVASEVKPFLDNAVREQTSALEARVRNDPFIENAARSEWAKLCRAIPLGAVGQATGSATGQDSGPALPNLWLEVRPTHAIAAQPKIGADAVTLFVGVQAQTRVVPSETKPDCPFPQQLDIVPQSDAGRVDIAVPIDVPFTAVSRLIAAQLEGKTFPEDASGSTATTIKQVAVAASGDRLLISLLVDVKRRGFFSFGGDASVHIWGRPVLDQDRQIIRFADVAVDVQSVAAFGLLGAAAQAAVPSLQKTIAEQAFIDLKPFAADAKKRIAAAVGALNAQGSGVTGTVAITDLRLGDIAYDEKTLRIIADAKGTVNATISSLPMQEPGLQR